MKRILLIAPSFDYYNFQKESAIGQVQEEVSDIPTRLADEVLKAVEQESRGIRFASSDDQATGL